MEQTLKDPLSGAEIVEAVLDRLRETMRRDCYLNPNSAYQYFKGVVRIELTLHDTGADVKTNFVANVERGQEPGEGVEVVEVDQTVEIEPAAPNAVRVSSGQPVPTLTKDAEGRNVVKGVKYARKGAKVS